MSNLVTLDRLLEMTHDWDRNLSDFRVNSRDVEFGDAMNLFFTPQTNNGGNGLFDKIPKVTAEAVTNEHSFSQLCGRILVPPSWAGDEDKCPAPLRKGVMNWKFQNFEAKDWLIRCRDNADQSIARAVLSDQYTPYDNKEFVDALVEGVRIAGLDAEVFRPEVGDELRGYILIKGIDFEGGGDPDPPRGDGGGNGGLRPAIHFRNSEIGTSRIRINGGLFRSYCANGLIFGWKSEESFKIVHRWKTEKHMALFVHEAIASALKMSEDAAIKFLDARAIRIEPTKVEDIINDWTSKYGLSVESTEGWLIQCQAKVQRHNRISKFDLINDLTFSASTIDNPQTREQMEIMAGDMIYAELPNRYVEVRNDFRTPEVSH